MENLQQNDDLANQFSHIKGWGVDADPENDPTYPMKRYNGRDHLRSNYPKPEQQEETVEILKTVGRKDLSSVFGTSVPPRGLSGMIRRWAFKYNEDSYAHWLPLIIADRVDAIEGMIDDVKQGHVCNYFAERGYGAEWKYNKKKFITRMAVTALATAAVITILAKKKKNKKEEGSAPFNSPGFAGF